MKLPTGVSEKHFRKALDEFREVCGVEWVFDNETDLSTYVDPYSSMKGIEGRSFPSAAVAPTSVEKVQQVVGIANKYKIPLWIISTGKNYGYGGPDALVDGSVIVDLKRMNRILEINEERAYAIVEPGVSSHDLYREIKKRGYKLWVDGPSPAYSSIIANTSERGVGYGLAGTRLDHQCGMEVVLPNGEVLRTGMGGVEGSETWAQYKFGFGPYVDGLFSQSSFGIITKMGIWLTPEPEHFIAAKITTDKFDTVYPIIDTLVPLRIKGIVQNAVSVMPAMPPITADAARMGPPPPQMVKMMRQKLGWNIRAGFYGVEKVAEGNFKAAQKTLSAALPGAKFEVERYQQPYGDPIAWSSEAKLAAGIPSFDEQEFWDHSIVFGSLVFPSTGQGYKTLVELVDRMMEKHGASISIGAIHNHEPRACIGLMLAFTGKDPEMNARTNTMMKDFFAEGSKLGFGEYRAPLAYMQDAADGYSYNNNAQNRFFTALKDHLDPNGIFAPGKNGIWPERFRNNNG